MTSDNAPEYPKTIGWEPCPQCGAKARRELGTAEARYVDVLCTADGDHNFREAREDL